MLYRLGLKLELDHLVWYPEMFGKVLIIYINNIQGLRYGIKRLLVVVV